MDNSQLAARIEAAAKVAQQTAKEILAEAPALVALTAVGPRVVADTDAVRTVERRANNDVHLSPQGRASKVNEAKAEFYRSVEVLREKYIGAPLDALLKRYPFGTPPLPDAAQLPIVAHYNSLPTTVIPERYLQIAGEQLDKASDPQTPGADRFAINKILAHSFALQLERLAVAPPGYWKDFATQVDELRSLVTKHIASAWDQPTAEGVADAVAQARRDFDWITQNALTMTPDILQIGARGLFLR